MLIIYRLFREDMQVEEIGYNYKITVLDGNEIIMDDEGFDALTEKVNAIREIRKKRQKELQKEGVFTKDIEEIE